MEDTKVAAGEGVGMDSWEVQGFLDGYGDGRAAWSVGVNGVAGVVAYVAKALPDTEADAILIRRARQTDREETIGRWQFIGGDARERLARHLYVEAGSLEADAGRRWDMGWVSDARKDHWRAAAERALGATFGSEE